MLLKHDIPGLKQKIADLEKEEEILGVQISDMTVVRDRKRFEKVSREYREIRQLLNVYGRLLTVTENIGQAEDLLEEEGDEELLLLAEEEVKELSGEREELEQQLLLMLLPKDPNDAKNTILEIRAGTGGDEAGLFAGDLFRMYGRFAEKMGWKNEVLSSNPNPVGGFKEIIISVSGEAVFSKLKYESGTHRVQRVPVTESSGRIHTSAVTVAVMPEAEEVDVDLRNDELRVDVFRSSGPGGQSVNTTDSGVRITHLPSNTVVTCQDEKSQHKNKVKAMKVLRSRLLQRMEEEQAAKDAAARRKQVGSGDRSERIRTYNFPQGRITDHRINLTLFKLNEVLEGDLALVTEPLIQNEKEKRLASGGEPSSARIQSENEK